MSLQYFFYLRLVILATEMKRGKYSDVQNFNILMIPVKAISTQISMLDLYSFVLEDSLRMARLCRNM